MTGKMPKGGVKDHMVELYTPKKEWPGKKEMSQEEKELAILEGDTSATLKDGVALTKASSQVKTTLPMYSEGLRLHRVVQVSTGFGHTLILTAVGVVLSYGKNVEGQLGHGDQKKRSGAAVIKALKGITIVGVAAGLHHSCVIAQASLQKTFTFGKNDRGQLGCGDPKTLPRSTKPMLVKPIWGTTNQHLEPVQVSAGNYHTGVVDIHGALFMWGDNRNGQLGIGHVPSNALGHNGTAQRPAASPGAPRRVVGALGSTYKYPVDHVSCGAFHSAVVTESGSLWTCGKAKGGQLGHPNQLENMTEFKSILSLDPYLIVHCDAGSQHTVCCDDEGVSFSFGSNTNKQLGLIGISKQDQWEDKRHEKQFGSRHNIQSRGHPIKPMELLPSRSPSRSSSRSPSRSSSRGGQQSSRGSSRGRSRSPSRASNRSKNQQQQQLLMPSLLESDPSVSAASSVIKPIKYPKNSSNPRVITSLEGQEVRQVAAGGKHTLFITKEGNLFSCGTAGSNARLGHLNDEEQSIPKLVEYFTKRTVSEDDRWVISFRSIFSMSVPPETIHDRRRALPKEAAVVNGKLLNGNKMSTEDLEDVQKLLVDVKYANIRRQCMNLFRHYDSKTRGYLNPLGIERIFPRVGIFMFDFQIDRVCKSYHRQGDPGGSNQITEARLLEYLSNTRKDLQKGILHTIWKTGIASSPPPFVAEDFIEEFCELFEKKCNEYGEPAPHEAVHLLSKPTPPVGRRKPLKKDKRRYRRIMKGKLNLQNCGLTDVHMKALMFAQKAVPIFHTLDVSLMLFFGT